MVVGMGQPRMQGKSKETGVSLIRGLLDVLLHSLLFRYEKWIDLAMVCVVVAGRLVLGQISP